jgi:hypothetical protein
MINVLKDAIAKSKIARLKSSSSQEFMLPVQSVVIVLDSQNLSNLPVLMKLKKELKLVDSEFQVVLFENKNESFPEFEGLIFTKEDFDFLGNFKSTELMRFAGNNIDLLITFANENTLYVDLFIASCIAGLKVGRHVDNEDILDLIIRSGDEVEVFTSELIKYLKQFKSN